MYWLRLATGNSLKTILTPAALKYPNLMATTDRYPFLCTISVEHHIIGRTFGEMA